MDIERSDRHHLLVTVEADDEVADQTAGSTLRVRTRDIDHPEADATVDAEVVYVVDRDLYAAAWYYDGIVRRRENRDGDPQTRYLTPGDEGFSETHLAPPDATVLWTPDVPWDRQGGARHREGD